MRGGAEAGHGVPSGQQGWFLPDPEEFEFLMGHAPPRPMGYLGVFLNDARHGESLALWGAALGLAALGLAIGQWWAVAGGALALGFYAWGVVRVVRSRRHAPVVLGVIDGWDAGRTGRFVTATARLPGGDEVRVGLHQRWVSEVDKFRGPVEALILHSPRARLCSVVGLRAVDGPPEE